jgi:hypothetical protein
MMSSKVGKETAFLRLNSTRIWMLVGLALVVSFAAGAYLFASSRVLKIGFPLDDAWIHQTYARNLGMRGEWAFIPGQPSAGSTAPLWSLLLAVGYMLRIPYLVWTYLLGGLSLLGLALCGEALLRSYIPAWRSVFPLAALFLIGEWHMTWAAVSGMETLLAGMLILLVLWVVSRAQGRAWLAAGLLIGVSIWVRPDGITLLGPAAFTLLLTEENLRKHLKNFAWLAGGFLLLFLPYLIFNLAVQGSLWPNTFYAKQAEYAVLRQTSLLIRFWDEIKLPLVGSGMFLLPGFLSFTWNAVRDRRWAAVGAVIWFLGYGLLYALRLPVIYQYGRYFMPAMPVYFVIGLAGTIHLVGWLRTGRLRWLLGRVWLLSGAVVWVAFFVIGAGRYAQDVAIIETEMVSAAQWVAANTEPGALVAAHDIGAMGYFSNRKLLDLAGLVSPEVIPFIRDEAHLARWLDAQGTSYLVVFAGWYPQLPDHKPVVYQTEGKFSASSGGTNTIVYRWLP